MAERLDLTSMVAGDAIPLTPLDATVYSPPLVGLYVGGTGDVTVKGRGGNAVTFKACPVGFRLDMLISRVMSTGTTATLLTGFVQ